MSKSEQFWDLEFVEVLYLCLKFRFCV